LQFCRPVKISRFTDYLKLNSGAGANGFGIQYMLGNYLTRKPENQAKAI
jgi:hypothetical protein